MSKFIAQAKKHIVEIVGLISIASFSIQYVAKQIVAVIQLFQ
jgi:hypothetical protein